MKFMDRVITPRGAGLVIGRDNAGTVLVSIAKRDLVKGSCQGPCINVWVKMDQVQTPVAVVRAGGKNGR